MAAKKNPKADEAYKLYKDGMKLVDIANQLGVPDGTVRRWKSTYEWDNERSDKKSERSEKKRAKKKAVIDDGTKDTLQNEELTPEQQMFCIYYIRTFNATQSYQKAYGCSHDSALRAGPRLLGNVGVRTEIERLKEMKRRQIVVGEEDIVELQMRIAFSDITDFVEFGNDDVSGLKICNVIIKNDNEVDGSLISEISTNQNGIKIKLADKQKAIDWLTKYFNVNPMDKHKQEFDRQKMELELLKIEMQTKADGNDEEAAEDNFLEALNAAAKDVWSDE